MPQPIITLPPRTDGQPAAALPKGTRRITVIGANGAGKSRFASRLAADLGDRAINVSALSAIYDTRSDRETSPAGIDALFDALTARSPLVNRDLPSRFERLVALLIDEEMASLFARKYGDVDSVGSGHPTRLERLVSEWESVFPDNRILLDSGQLHFSRVDAADNDCYVSARLSDGEKAVIYYLGVALLAPREAVLVVDHPSMFLNRAMIGKVWDMVEAMRPDLTMVYVTHNLDFMTSRSRRGDAVTVWVKRYDAALHRWDYDLLPAGGDVAEEVYQAVIGARKPVLFIEGDGVNSIDAKLYPLVFRDYTVKSLGSCNKVIEAVRTFNDLTALHSMASMGIVDRDRRNEHEVAYLRRRGIMVPDVAEIENILMLEDVVRAVASHYGRDEDKAFARVSRNILKIFDAELEQQALLHTRHRVKVDVEHCIDRKFTDITRLERHLAALVRQINPRGFYNQTCHRFRQILEAGDYAGVLRVFNRKSMLSESNVAGLCGVPKPDKETYIRAILKILRRGGPDAARIRTAIKHCFGINENQKD